MIIGKDKINKSFTNNYNPVNQTTQSQNININTMKNANVLNKKEMNDKSFMMLQDRLNKGLITLEEFNKMCNKLNKK